MPLGVLPTTPPFDLGAVAMPLRRAEMALARLSGVAGLVPAMPWLLFGSQRREAVMSAQMDGIAATLTNCIDLEAGLHTTTPTASSTASSTASPSSNFETITTVLHGLQAARHLQDQLRQAQGPSLGAALLASTHATLLGEAPTDITLPEAQASAMAQWAQFIHVEDPAHTLPPLVRTALAYGQLELIRPHAHAFAKGHGRLARLVVPALLEHWGLLAQPLLDFSATLRQRQREHVRLLAALPTDGDWEAWVAFFLDAVESAAIEGECHTVAVAALVADDRRRLMATARTSAVALRLFERLPTMPKFTIDQARLALDTTFPTAAVAVKVLQDLGILVESTGLKKNRAFGYQAYVELLVR